MSQTALTRVDERSVAARPELQDAPAFHSTVLRAVGGAAAAGLALDLVSRAAGYLHPSMVGLVTASLVGALALVGSDRGRGLGRTLGAALGGGLGLLGAFLVLLTAEWPWIGALLAGAAAAPVLARGESAKKMAATGAFAGAMTLAGLYVLRVLATRGILGPVMPGPLASAAVGAAAGLFIGLGALPRHFGSREDAVEVAFGRAVGGAEGEIREILERASQIYGAIRSDLSGKKGPTEKRLGRQVSDLSLRILHISEQCQKIQRDLGGAERGELERRITELTAKAGAAQDQAAKRTLLAAVESLDGQRRAVDAIGRGLERVVARLHANVAMLEKVRFSLVHARSADAERFGGESSPLAETIDELSRELDATSIAVGEVFSEGYGSSDAPALAAPKAKNEASLGDGSTSSASKEAASTDARATPDPQNAEEKAADPKLDAKP